MRFLCVCAYGHSRSAAMVQVLHHYGQEAISAGLITCSETWLSLLLSQVDYVICMTPEIHGTITKIIESKHFLTRLKYRTLLCDVGKDRWSNPYHPELKILCDTFYRTSIVNHLPSLIPGLVPK